jgi:small conductance mechanosensitive channel
VLDPSDPSQVTRAVVEAIVIFVAATVVGQLFDRFFVKLARHTHGTSEGKLVITRRTFQVIVYIIAFLFLLIDLQVDVSGLAAGIGVAALVLSILLQDVVVNWFAGIAIMVGRVYRLGDVIQVGPLTGVVTEVTARTTHLKTYDRNEIILPNVNLLNDNIINLTGGKKETVASLNVAIDYTFDTAKAKGLILEALKATPHVVIDEARKREVRFVIRTEEWATRIEVLYWVDEPENQVFIQSALTERVREALLGAGILPPLPITVRDRFLPKTG